MAKPESNETTLMRAHNTLRILHGEARDSYPCATAMLKRAMDLIEEVIEDKEPYVSFCLVDEQHSRELKTGESHNTFCRGSNARSS